MTVEDELEESCFLLLKLKELKGPDKKIEFLQRYVEKSKNCISAVDYLTFLYLEQGKVKECLLLATDYLDKL